MHSVFLEALNDSWIICYSGWPLVKGICIQTQNCHQTPCVTFLSHASHSLRIHRESRFGLLASHPLLLWQQLSVCCPDSLFAQGMVAICWRRLNLSVPAFQTARYVFVYVCACMFLRSLMCTCSCKLLPFPPWLDLRIGSGTCLRGPLVLSLDWHILQHVDWRTGGIGTLMVGV